MANAHDLLMAQRAAMMGGKSIPYDAEVEYLTNDGNQYIDSGYFTSSEIGWECDLAADNSNSVFCGSLADNRHYQFARGVFFFKSGSSYSSLNALSNYQLGDRVLHSVDTVNGLLSSTYNGQKYSVSFDETFFSESTKFIIFGFSFRGNITLSSGNQYAFIGKMYGFKLFNGGVLALDLIPVRFTNENGDDEGAMYDRVSGQLFRNSGTGAFIIGPDK